MKKINLKSGTLQLQKATLLGTARILRKIGPYVLFNEFRLPNFLTISDFSVEFPLFDDFSDEFLQGGKLLYSHEATRQKSWKSAERSEIEIRQMANLGHHIFGSFGTQQNPKGFF